jgi:hypothetical protein
MFPVEFHNFRDILIQERRDGEPRVFFHPKEGDQADNPVSPKIECPGQIAPAFGKYKGTLVILHKISNHHVNVRFLQVVYCRFDQPEGRGATPVGFIHPEIEHVSDFTGFTQYIGLKMHDAHQSDNPVFRAGHKVPGIGIEQPVQGVKPGSPVHKKGNHSFLRTPSGQIKNPFVVGFFGKTKGYGTHGSLYFRFSPVLSAGLRIW